MIIYGKTEWERDFKEVIELCGTWWKESLFYKLYGIEYDVDVDLFQRLKDAEGLIYTIGRENGMVISCYVGIKSPYLFNPKVLTATEVVWCIRKENRCFKNLVCLIRAIETLMDEENLKLWNLNVSNEEKYESTGKFLTLKGYDFMDKCFSKLRTKNG